KVAAVSSSRSPVDAGRVPIYHPTTLFDPHFSNRPMRIGEVYRPGQFGLSFEICPPKSADGDAALWENVERLTGFRPAFVSCTYGAGGSTRSRTVDLCQEIQTRFGVAATAHFTCVGGTRDEMREWLTLARSRGIRNIMALRGDPPAGQTEFRQ